MNENRVTIPGVVWVAAAVAFLLIFGAVWFASSMGDVTPVNARMSSSGVPAGMGRGIEDRVYNERVAPEQPVGVVRLAPESPLVTGLPEQAAESATKPKLPRKITPRDMFPVGDITRDMPKHSHPFRQIAELFPSFAYEGRLWRTTGRYVLSSEAELTPTGCSLTTGQKLYALANTSAPSAVLFVRSTVDPSKFAVYRRL